MKRFYCTVCRKVKRVRRWPSTLKTADSINPFERIGVCERHIIYRAPVAAFKPLVEDEKAEGKTRAQLRFAAKWSR
jgi:hypothetical protein